MRYMIRAFPQSYCYIGDFIDLGPQEQRTIDLVKSKIQEKSLSKGDAEKIPNVSTFNVKAKGHCYQCGKVGRQAKDCLNNHQNNNGNGKKQGNQTRYALRGQRSTQRGYSKGAAHRGYSRGRGSGHQRARSNEQYESSHESWVTQLKKHLCNYVNLTNPIDVKLTDDKIFKATKIRDVKVL